LDLPCILVYLAINKIETKMFIDAVLCPLPSPPPPSPPSPLNQWQETILGYRVAKIIKLLVIIAICSTLEERDAKLFYIHFSETCNLF
jgi:hypothetical protein